MKVRLHFTLVGKSNEWKRNMPKGVEAEFTNNDTLSFVRDTVSGQFGSRALVIVNEQLLSNDMRPYPEFYAAGWFVSEENPERELVLVEHGDSMEAANKAMMDSVSTIDWESFSEVV